MKLISNGIEIEYEAFGNCADPALIMIAGLGSQLITWDPDFLQLFVDEGLYVVVFDNRDIGKSTWLDHLGKADLEKAAQGMAPYYLRDMAADTMGLIRELELDRPHVFGVSMGGMIAQQLVIDYPDQVATMTSVMSTTGDPSVGQATPDAGKQLARSAPTNRDEYIEATWQRFQVTGTSPSFRVDEQHIRDRAARAYDRGIHGEGNGRQLAAVFASGDRTLALGSVVTPTAVIHGSDDALVDVSGGRATADAIPNAKLRIIEGMGHHLPRGAWPQVIEAALDGIRRA